MKLLDPTQMPWGEHFSRVGDLLEPLTGDKDAEYTHSAYDLNSPEKVKFRELRRITIEKRREFIRRAIGTESALLNQASQIADPTEILETALTLRLAIDLALEDLAQFAAVPPDAATACRCGPEMSLSLPPQLMDQLIDIGE